MQYGEGFFSDLLCAAFSDFVLRLSGPWRSNGFSIFIDILSVKKITDSKEENALLEFYIPGINERQAQIIKTIVEKGNTVFVSRELENVMNVSVKTIRSDLEGLVQLGLLEKVPMNKRLFGYIKSSSFESRLREIRGN